jgi:hypothetical protein
MAHNDVVYWSQEELQSVPATATILAFGDSWFHYPMYSGSLVNSIGDLVKPTGRRILSTGQNGLEIRQFVQGYWQKRFRNAIRLYGPHCEAVLISGGGNDFAGFDDLRPLLNGNCKDAQSALDCFRPGDGEFTLNDLQYKVYRAYAQFILEASLTVPKNAKFFVHNYDYAPVTGKGVFGGEAWIRPALADAQVPPHLYDECVRLIIDGHSNTLKDLAASLPDRVVFIDGRNTLAPEDWANELHPTGAGFAKMVQMRWKAPLEEAGLCT